MASLLHLWTLLLGWVEVGGIEITSEDLKYRDLAIDKTAEYCGTGDYTVETYDKDTARSVLEDAVGGEGEDGNVVWTILKKATSSDDLERVLEEELSVSFLISKATPLVLSIVIITLWVVFAWVICPCQCCGDRRCYRCCEKKHKTRCLAKSILVFAALGLGVGVLCSALLAITGYYKVKDGFEDLGCRAASFLNVSYNGQSYPEFIGVFPMIEIIEDLTDSLDDDSEMITSITSLLDNTESIDHALDMSNAVLGLMHDMLQTTANMNPYDADGNFLGHNCTICYYLGEYVSAVKTAINTSAAQELSAARSEVREQLSESNRATIVAQIESGTEPITQVKTMLNSATEYILEEDAFGTLKNNTTGSRPWVLAAIAVIIGLAFFIAVCSIATLGMFGVKERIREGDRHYVNPKVHRAAACTWCSAWLYAFLVFLVGGILHVVCVPLSGTCLIMIDVYDNFINQTASAFDLSLNADTVNMTDTIIKKCYAADDITQSANLLDIVYSYDGGEKKYMRTTLNEVIDPITDDMKDAVESFTNFSNISDLTAVTAFIDLIQDNSVANWYYTGGYLASHDTYAYLFVDDGIATLSTAEAVTMLCASERIVSEALGLNQSMYGINSWMDEFESYSAGTDKTVNCTSTIVCNTSMSDTSQAKCAAGNAFIELKQSIFESDRFRCDLFTDADGNVCNPKDMTSSTASGQTTYSNDCMLANGSWVTQKVTCSWDEYVEYIATFATWMELVVERLDVTIIEKGDSVVVSMNDIVSQYVIDPMDTIINGSNCYMLHDTLSYFTSSFCYEVVWGLYSVSRAFVLDASMSVVMSVLVFAIWRRAVDNYNIEPDDGTITVEPDPQK